jgi:hypothetical protein
MIKITGLDKLQRDLKRASTALGDMDGDLGTVHFNPQDPASIEAAIAETEHLIDQQLGNDADNPILGPLAQQMKAAYRQGILDRAAEARLKESVAEGDEDKPSG